MKRISTIEEFREYRLSFMKQDALAQSQPCLVLCAGTGGQASGSNDVLRVIKRRIVENNLQDKISIRVTGCQGFCEMDPFVLVEPGNHLYPKIKMEDIPMIMDAALEGKVIENLLYKEKYQSGPCQGQAEIPFFKKQTRLILGGNQNIDPIKIADYLKQGGYAAFDKALFRSDPEWIIREISASGLRGRGGAGFPTGKKWALARRAGGGSKEKYIICNADEGDPGAYMDRSLLEGNPHSIIEGMLIASIAIGAKQGFIYVRSEYPLAIKHALVAIRQCRQIGLLGQNILDSGLDFDISIVRGAGAFVCGEETALIRSIEGYVGEPHQRPPYPIDRGLLGKPTCINNVETLANIALIIGRGAEEYSKIGVPGNTGTKIFSLVGKIANTGLVEVPLGMKISDVVYEIGGGSIGGSKIKAIQTGGPSGGCIPASMFDLSIDYDSLKDAGAIMGSGGMIVMDENTCMVDVAKYFMKFLKSESCGKCFTCRKGTQRMYEILDDITSGRGTLQQLDLLYQLAVAVKDTTMCGLGNTASNPVLSTLKYFKAEYLEHIVEKRCSAGVCKDLVGAPCQDACPLGTEAWRYIAHIQRGEFLQAYRVLRETNPFPSVCARVCNHPCEQRCRAGLSGAEPIAIRSLKRIVIDSIVPADIKVKPFTAKGKYEEKVAIIGAGPAGLTAAYYLSILGYPVDVIERENQPGGMLVAGIPAYRMPRDVLKKEIDALFDDRVNFRFNTALGRDVSIDTLFSDGYTAIFLSMGSHKSKKMGIPNENTLGVVSGMEFLKAFNLHEKILAHGDVAVIGGGNSAVDAARVAIRLPKVKSVTILYRRDRDQMPAYDEEIEAALEEGVKIETLVTPTLINASEGRLASIECVRNELGAFDTTGRKIPIPLNDTQWIVSIDTLIVAIGEDPDTSILSTMGIDIDKNKTVSINAKTCQTSRPGVFAGGDLATGPNTIVDAIAAGKRAASMIDRYARGLRLDQPENVRLPTVFVEPVAKESLEYEEKKRFTPVRIPVEERKNNFLEVEKSISTEEAIRESCRCLRCDLEFTQTKDLQLNCDCSVGGIK